MADRATKDGTEKEKPHRSRRELLAGAAGVLGVLGVEALAKASPAQAANGDPVLLGYGNIATAQTQITASTAGPVLQLTGQGDTAAGLYAYVDENVAVQGESSTGRGVLGESDAGQAGVYGTSVSGEGVYGQAGTTAGTNPGGAKNGVHGVSDSSTDSAVWGENVGGGYGVAGATTSPSGGPPACQGVNGGGGDGVFGLSLSGIGVKGTSSGGNAGLFATSSSGEGVYGQSGSTAGTTPGTAHHGVHGVTDAPGNCGVFGEYVGGGTAAAVQGTNVTGRGQGVIGFGQTGVYGLPLTGGTGVLASTAFDGTGLALNAVGPTQFSLSGLVSIAAGAKSAVVTGVSLRSGSLVLATLQNSAGVQVASAVPTVARSKVTINLNTAVPTGKTAKVAWFVVN